MSEVATLEPEPHVAPVDAPTGTSIFDDESLYEVVDGERREKPPMGNFQVLVAGVLDQILGAFARSNRLGRVVPEMLFELHPSGGPQRRPDVAFVSYARWPKDRKVDSGDGWKVIPDLAIEVISPSNTAEAMLAKIVEYLKAGVTLVWAVYPENRQVHVYRLPTQVKILGLGDELDGEDLLPGFHFALTELFEDGV